MLPILTPNSTLKPAYQGYLERLRQSKFTGDIRADYAARLAVANDNSVYQLVPEAVIFPRNGADIAIALKLADPDIKFAPRGGGTATNGQSLSAGIIIDCSKYMRDILEVNLKEGWVRVQPGVVLDQLNQQLRPMGVQFAPEISPSNRATIGGMINTDACGVGSKVLGRTSDHVIELNYVLMSGDILNSNDTIFFEQELIELLQSHHRLIQEKFFKAPRTLCGYNLLKTYQSKLNLNYLLSGSEGTLAVISECKLKLSPIPKFSQLLVIKYRTFDDALKAKEITSTIHPLVIETIDEKLIKLAREDKLYFQIRDFIEPADAINLVEFVADNEQDIAQQIKMLCDNIDASDLALGYYIAKDALETKLLWELRKKSVGLISKGRDGSRRPIPFVEDTAVPPENLAAYIHDFKLLLDQHQLIYGMYGHVDAGCIHVRPALDLKLEQDEKLLREISNEVVALVKKHGGVIWGEHGKGFRSEFGPEFFGDELYLVCRKIKTLFDPHNQLNPGKVATSLTEHEELVKLDSHLRGSYDKQIRPDLQAEFVNPLTCNGNGACFNFSSQDVMCPSFKVTQDRIHSPKGRATVMREWLRLLSFSVTPKFNLKILNSVNRKEDFSHEVYEAMSGCLGCKACVNQCPLNVDVPDFKSSFLERYHQRYLRPLRDYFIANTEKLARWQAQAPRFTSWLISNNFTQLMLKKYIGLVDPPCHADASWQPTENQISDNAIVLVQDAFTSFYDRPILKAAYEFFSALGFTVYVAPFFENGKPLHVKGFLKKFSTLAKKNISYLNSFAEKNIPLIGIDPSITLTYRDEYQKLMRQEKINFNVLLPQEFLMQHLEKLPQLNTPSHYFLLSHCTEKTTQPETEKQWKTIFAAMGINLTPLSAGCCGMAGSYGHEAEHVANSRALFNLDWQKYLRDNDKQPILATGYSCRSQVKRFENRQLQHPLEVLRSLL